MDPISDMLTRIRNSQHACHSSAAVPYSRLKEDLLKVIYKVGFIKGYEVMGEGVKKQLVVLLRYVKGGLPIISGLKRVSRPGRRVYRGCDEFDDVCPGRGYAIVSTNKGIMTHEEALRSSLGGEVLCQIW